MDHTGQRFFDCHLVLLRKLEADQAPRLWRGEALASELAMEHLCSEDELESSYGSLDGEEQQRSACPSEGSRNDLVHLEFRHARITFIHRGIDYGLPSVD